MGAAGEVTIPEQLGLAPEEFNQYRSYLLKTCLANETIDNEHTHLQPTSAGYALVRLIDKLDSVAINDGESKDLAVEECSPLPISSDRAATVELLRKGLLQSYVLEQAEVIRLETQLRYSEANEKLIEETEAIEIMEEFREHQRRLSVLQDFLKILPNLLGGLHK